MFKQKQKFPYLIVTVSILLGCLFLTLFYFAVSNEPDYMPSQQKTHHSIEHHQH